MYHIGILTSGLSRGSNLRAIAGYFRDNDLPVRISFAVKTRNKAPMTEVCAVFNIPCYHIIYDSTEQFEVELTRLKKTHPLDMLCLAGFLKQLTPNFIKSAGIPILNIHPALLPKYGGSGMYGMKVHQAVFAARDEYSGATIHLVDEHYDHGAIIAQERTAISECHSPEEIAHRVLEIEHQIYGRAIYDYLKTHSQ